MGPLPLSQGEGAPDEIGSNRMQMERGTGTP